MEQVSKKVKTEDNSSRSLKDSKSSLLCLISILVYPVSTNFISSTYCTTITKILVLNGFRRRKRTYIIGIIIMNSFQWRSNRRRKSWAEENQFPGHRRSRETAWSYWYDSHWCLTLYLSLEDKKDELMSYLNLTSSWMSNLTSSWMSNPVVITAEEGKLTL